MALLHLAPRLGDFAHNRSQVEAAVRQAARHGAAWVLTPELCLSGYQFAPALGTEPARRGAWTSARRRARW
jgi:predicted amidohydrolase